MYSYKEESLILNINLIASAVRMGICKKNIKRYWHYTQSFIYKSWRKKVFERDEYSCQKCGQIAGYLTAHHKKSWAKYPKLRYKLTNGITLCEDCHKLTDNYKGRGKGGQRAQ